MHLEKEALFLLQASIFIGLPYLIWRVNFVRKFMPVVVIQILCGLLLGPSVLGHFSPQAFHFLFPPDSLPFLSGLSWMAIVLFGFLTGLHFDMNEFKGKGMSFLATGAASILIPFILGGIVAFWLYQTFPQLAGSQATQLTFVFAMGIAASVTALPVLGAILVEMGLITNSIGKTILGYATLVDGALWIFVAILLAIVSGDGDFMGVAKTIGFSFLYLLFMIAVVRPLLNSFVKRKLWTIDPNNVQLVAVSVFLIISAFLTQLIGIHYLLGAFIYGALIPKNIAHALYRKKEPLVLVILLPFFFISAGLQTKFDITSPVIWIVFIMTTLVSAIGKIAGTSLTAHFLGHYDKKTSLTFGVFMMCKGMMDLVILGILLGAKIISPITYSGMILTALTLAAATKPIGRLLVPQANGNTGK